MNYNWDFGALASFKPALLAGISTTLQLSGLAIVFGTGGGLLLALGLLSRLRPLQVVLGATVEIVRAIPLLVLLIWMYYCIPLLTGIVLSSFNTALIAMAINLSAFIAEVLRGGVRAIPRGYLEAGLAVGFTYPKVIMTLMIPQAFRQTLPAIVGLYISMVKLSSLASVIAVEELLHKSNGIISLTFKPLEVYTCLALAYVILILPPVVLAKRLEFNSRKAGAAFQKPGSENDR